MLLAISVRLAASKDKGVSGRLIARPIAVKPASTIKAAASQPNQLPGRRLMIGCACRRAWTPCDS